MDWKPISTAPKDGTRVRVIMDTGTVYKKAFWTDEPFANINPPIGGGWFIPLPDTRTYAGIVEPKGWKPRKRKDS